MARFYREGAEVQNTRLASWNRIDEEFARHPDEHRAARVVYRFTGHEPHLWDTDGRERASDIILRTDGTPIAVVEVSSTYDPLLRRDMHNCDLLEAEMNAGYERSRHWILHMKRGWQIPPQRERRRLAHHIRKELEGRKDDGFLRSAEWLFAWGADDEESRIEIRGWDSRVPPTMRVGSAHLAAFLDSDLIQGKRSKLRADAEGLEVPARHLYLSTTPTGSHAHIATTHAWDLADGAFVLPPDLDEIWLDSRGATVRRFARDVGWTEYRL